MYAYQLLVHTPGARSTRWYMDGDGIPYSAYPVEPRNPSDWVPVHPAPERGLEIPTLAALKEQVLHDLGMLPGWLADLDAQHPKDTNEYLQVEDEVECFGLWFLLDIEGSETHVLPPLAWSIAFVRDPGKVAGT